MQVLLVQMAPKMKLPQRRKSIRGLEESEHKKKMAAEPSPTPILAPSPASASTQSPISPSKVPLSDQKVKPRKNIDFKFFEKERFSIRIKIKNQGWEFYHLLKENTLC